ncbi:MAG: hypothetical protein IPH84_10575 [Bacteroidales bacterium]|nr:hypothetical protein [Bacteroidales bacterium]
MSLIFFIYKRYIQVLTIGLVFPAISMSFDYIINVKKK